jgi:hypothetical protein
MWRVYLLSALLACVVAAVTAFVTVRLLPQPPAPDTPRTQILEGVANVPMGGNHKVFPEQFRLEVFYTTAFASPPHLTFPEGLSDGTNYVCRLVEQKAGSFILEREPFSGPSTAPIKWRAEGVPAK